MKHDTIKPRRPVKRREPVAKRDPFPFVLEELSPLRPTIKRMFGFTSVYLDEKLLCSLRDSVKQPGSNGMWLYTTKEHLESLAREFPQLSKRQLWRSRSGDKAWVVIASRLEEFEEYAFRACALILKGDRRIGRLTRGVGKPARASVLKSSWADPFSFT
jgi:hypothetical protein